VNINSVIGAGVKEQWDAVTIGKRAVELGFTSTVGIINDGSGQLRPGCCMMMGCARDR